MLFALPATSRPRSCATARTNALQSPLFAGQCLVHAPITRPRLPAASAPPTSAIAMSEARSVHNESAAFSKNRRLVLRCRILRPGREPDGGGLPEQLGGRRLSMHRDDVFARLTENNRLYQLP